MDALRQQEAKKWVRKCIGGLLAVMGGILLAVVIADPFFHYHKPLPFMSYRLYEERYMNDGIARHFDYDAIITGTSMAQNFKTSEVDALFGTKAIKAPFSGAGYQEISQNLERALERNKNLKTVIWAVDYNGLLLDYDWKQYEDYPSYLYDDNIWNDAPYVFNKSVLYHGVAYNAAMTFAGLPGTSMDEYSSWIRETGIRHILYSRRRPSGGTESPVSFGEEEDARVTETVERNIIQLAEGHPDTEFYLCFTPYSICYWESLQAHGKLEAQIEAEKVAVEMLLQYPNIKLYNFFGQYDIICDLDNYSDQGHYSAEVNTMMLHWMREGTGLVTKEDYLKGLAAEKEFYSNYDYDSLYEGLEADE